MKLTELSTKFWIVSTKNGGAIKGPYSTLKRARAARERMDLAYGAIVPFVAIQDANGRRF